MKRCVGEQKKQSHGGQEGSTLISAQAEACRLPALRDPAMLCYYLVSFT